MIIATSFYAYQCTSCKIIYKNNYVFNVSEEEIKQHQPYRVEKTKKFITTRYFTTGTANTQTIK